MRIFILGLISVNMANFEVACLHVCVCIKAGKNQCTMKVNMDFLRIIFTKDNKFNSKQIPRPSAFNARSTFCCKMWEIFLHFLCICHWRLSTKVHGKCIYCALWHRLSSQAFPSSMLMSGHQTLELFNCMDLIT